MTTPPPPSSSCPVTSWDEAESDAALAWLVRLKDPLASADDRAAFRRWLAARPSHAAAFAAAQQLWDDSLAPARAAGRSGWYRHAAPARRWAWLGLVRPGAGLAVTALCFCLLAGGAQMWRDPGLIDRLGADFATPRGGLGSWTLDDGSHLTLDSDSAAGATFSAQDRHVTLHRGRGWFDVKPGAAPFTVAAGTASVRVLGTAFAVERQARGVAVVVERGRVEVTPATGAPALVLSAGQAVFLASDGQAAMPYAADPGAALAWRRGMAVFDRAPVAEVAATLERLRPGRVIVPDPATGQETISGTFRLDSPDVLIAALREGLGLTVVDLPGMVTVVSR